MSTYLKRSLILIGISLFCFGGTAKAEELSFQGEAITSFDTKVEVQTDGSILVTETIQYTTGGQEKHGIYRDINTSSSQGKEMGIEGLKVFPADVMKDMNYNKNGYSFEKINQGDTLRLKIGDPNNTFSGIRTFVIQYRATHAVGYFDNFDEIYWNTTGNNWPFPILTASAEVVLPSGATVIEGRCYEGVMGSQEFCDGDGNQFRARRILNPGEGMTVAVGFHKGVVVERYTLWERILQFLETMSLIIGIGIALWGGWSAYRRWYRDGRDPKERGVIVPEYSSPDNLTPLEASGLLSEAQVSQGAYIAQIISLATRGYIRIHQDQEKYVFGLITTNDYELERLTKSDALKSFDVLFLEKLFKGENRVRLSSLKNSFYKEIPAIDEMVMRSLKSDGYYKKIRETLSGGISWKNHLPFIVAMFLFAVSIPFGNMNILAGSGLAMIIWCVFAYFSPVKTEKGVRAKEQLKGLKLYIEKAEKARIEFHDAPEKTPELFSTLLPFAMVLGLTQIWLKEFEDLNFANPDWYAATGANHALMSNNFFHDFDSFSQAMTASTASPGSSGSGSSGGGGGGGGGGSW